MPVLRGSSLGRYARDFSIPDIFLPFVQLFRAISLYARGHICYSLVTSWKNLRKLHLVKIPRYALYLTRLIFHRLYLPGHETTFTVKEKLLKLAEATSLAAISGFTRGAGLVAQW